MAVPKIQNIQPICKVKKDKIPKPVAGLDGIYSLKRLAE
jgi:hypothetical protein